MRRCIECDEPFEPKDRNVRRCRYCNYRRATDLDDCFDSPVTQANIAREQTATDDAIERRSRDRDRTL